MSNQKFLIVIGGATATGKTALGIRLAQHFETEIISCDSRQFYKEMNIGTAKPDEEELAAAPHHFVGHLSIQDNYSVGDFERDGLQLLDQLYLKKDIVIMVGGSGLFIRALCEGLDQFPDISPTTKKEVQALYEKEGIEGLQKQLETTDPIYFKKVDQQNPVRLLRALNVIKESGKPFSSFQNQKKIPRNFTTIYINLSMDREMLYERINHRVDSMMAAGLLDEVQALIRFKNLNSLKTVGYQEFMDYFDKKISLEEAVELVKRNSRRYAKRQMTWFRKGEDWRAFGKEDWEEILEYVEGSIKKNN